MSSLEEAHSPPAASVSESAGRASKSAKLTSDSSATGGAAAAADQEKEKEKEVINLDDESTSATPVPQTNNTAAAQTTQQKASSASSSSTPATTAAHHISTRAQFTSASFEYVDGAAVSEFLMCALCVRPLYKPLQHKSCSNVFCERCLVDDAAATPTNCPDCTVAIRTRDTIQPAKPLLMMLESLSVRCQACSATMPRSAYAAHWLESCAQACPFASGGCAESHPRAALNAHIDTCAFAPVACVAAEFSCPWTGQREAASAHESACHLAQCLPVLTKLRSQPSAEHAEALALRDNEIAALRVALETREGQLRSYRNLDDHGMWRAGTLVDALDTENSWLLAKILKVDLAKKAYAIHYVDWDASWDEVIAFGSPRLAPGGTHTSSADVEKHVRKALAGGATAAATAAAASATAATSATQNVTEPARATTAGKNKRKAGGL